MMMPHIFCVLDFSWFGVYCGVAYYDVVNDAFRPAFVEFHLWRKWRVTF